MHDSLADTVISAATSGRSSTAGLERETAAVDDDTVIPLSSAVAHRAEPTDLHPEPAPEHPGARYRFRVNDGEAVATDRVTLVGRHPRPPRIGVGAEPRLIDVESPTRQVSGTHLELRQQGTAIVVTDLRSTNGTVVTVAGVRPVVLRPGESLVASPGSIIDIGDGNLIEILPAERLVPIDERAGMLP